MKLHLPTAKWIPDDIKNRITELVCLFHFKKLKSFSDYKLNKNNNFNFYSIKIPSIKMDIGSYDQIKQDNNY